MSRVSDNVQWWNGVAFCDRCSNVVFNKQKDTHHILCDRERSEQKNGSKYTQPTLAEEKQEVAAEIASISELAEGCNYYVISASWLKIWSDWTDTTSKPMPIDNSELLEEDSTSLKKGLSRGYDYEIVPTIVWFAFHKWYGGGPVIPRRAMGAGWYRKTLQVELYPIELQIVLQEKDGLRFPYSFSSTERIFEIRVHLVGLLSYWIPPHQVQVWLEDPADIEGFKLISRDQEQLSLEQLELKNGSVLLFRKIPVHHSASAMVSSFSGMSYSMPGSLISSTHWQAPLQKIPGKPPAKGMVGLKNLGNTCYMASLLQCLSHCEPLRHYFLAPGYDSYLKKEAVAKGSKALTTAFNAFLKDLWCGKYKILSPGAMRVAITTAAPQFNGYDQHDSHELLMIILDAFVTEIMVVPETHPELQPRLHLESIFTGQEKSTIICASCHKASVKNQDFVCLSLPVPTNDCRLIQIMLFRVGEYPAKYGVLVPKSGTIGTLITELSKIAELTLEDTSPASSGLCIFSIVSGIPFAAAPEKQLNQFDSRTKFSAYFYPYSKFPNQVPCTLNAKFWGDPLIISVPTDITHMALGEHICESLRMYTGGMVPERGEIEIFASTKGTNVDFEDHAFFNNPIDVKFQPVETFIVQWKGYDGPKMAQVIHVHPSDSIKIEDPTDVNILECMERYCSQETLSGENKSYCPTCASHQNSTKQLTLQKLPSVLILHLVRFEVTHCWKQKITTKVDFPLTELDLSKFVPQDGEHKVFDLFAVSYHHGPITHGHYTTASKSTEGDWLRLNDESVSFLEKPEEVQSADAYVLFYKSRNCVQPEFDVLELLAEHGEPLVDNHEKAPEMSHANAVVSNGELDIADGESASLAGCVVAADVVENVEMNIETQEDPGVPLKIAIPGDSIVGDVEMKTKGSEDAVVPMDEDVNAVNMKRKREDGDDDDKCDKKPKLGD